VFVDAFLLALIRFENDPVLRNVWFRYFARIHKRQFFRYVEHKLLAELERRPILRSSDDTYHRASQLLFIPSLFLDESGAPLRTGSISSPARSVISPPTMTCPQMDEIDKFFAASEYARCRRTISLRASPIMDKAKLFGSQSTAWHDMVAMCFLRLPRPPYGTIHADVLPLRILPLHNGNWAPAATAHLFMFAPGVSIPGDLGLQSIVRVSVSIPHDISSFIRLGVMPAAEPVQIARKILTVLGPRSVGRAPRTCSLLL